MTGKKLTPEESRAAGEARETTEKAPRIPMTERERPEIERESLLDQIARLTRERDEARKFLKLASDDCTRLTRIAMTSQADEAGETKRADANSEALTAALAREEKLKHALKYTATAIDMGRSEPLEVAREIIRNALEDCATLEDKP